MRHAGDTFTDERGQPRTVHGVGWGDDSREFVGEKTPRCSACWRGLAHSENVHQMEVDRSEVARAAQRERAKREVAKWFPPFMRRKQ